MKKSLILMALICFAITIQSKVYRVNNMPGVSADFTNFLSAQSASTRNDTLYIEGSTISYGQILLTKPLTIIGTGYFLEENPKTQANFITTEFESIGFSTGSEGSKVTGVEVQGTITVYVSNIAICNCFAKSIFLNYNTSIVNIILLCNYISQSSYSYGISSGYSFSSSSSNTISNLIISNNIFHVPNIESIHLGTNASGILNNNIFESSVSVYNSTISNNIQTSGTFNLNNNVFFNNIGNGNQFPVGNGNQQNMYMTDIFIGSTGSSKDGMWQLKQNSVANSAGKDGKDCGAFGGSTPYILSGLPSIPAIYEISCPSTGDNLNGLNVSIKAKTH